MREGTREEAYTSLTFNNMTGLFNFYAIPDLEPIVDVKISRCRPSCCLAGQAHEFELNEHQFGQQSET